MKSQTVETQVLPNLLPMSIDLMSESESPSRHTGIYVRACGEPDMFWVSDICCTHCFLQKHPVKFTSAKGLPENKKGKIKQQLLTEQHVFQAVKTQMPKNKNIVLESTNETGSFTYPKECLSEQLLKQPFFLHVKNIL